MRAQLTITTSIFDKNSSTKLAAFAWLAILAAAIAMVPVARAQTFQVIHTFSGGDGAEPQAGLVLSGQNLYGTTYYGGNLACECGTVFKLSRAGNGWLLSTLYRFQNGADGAHPYAPVAFGPDGVLYGTTPDGLLCCGTVFRLQPPASVCRSSSCLWTLTTILNFPNLASGYFPSYGPVSFDSAGNVYGTTQYGGRTGTCNGDGCGVIYQLTRNGNAWTENVIYAFTGINDGGLPYNGVTLDQAGNLYGTTFRGHDNGQYGVVYELSRSGSGWTNSVLYAFQNGEDGELPEGGVIFDQQGNLYGTTAAGGSGRGGTVFQLSPSGGSWNFNLLASMSGSGNVAGPLGNLTMDSAGNLYGTSVLNGLHQHGNVFKLTPVNGGWIYTSLYDFTGGSDGSSPIGQVVVDGSGNLYGTTQTGGGNCDCGVVWEITQ